VSPIVLCSLLALVPTLQPASHPTVSRETGSAWVAQGAYGEPALHNPAGAPVAGFALSLTANRYTIQQGDPLAFTVEVRNVSGLPNATAFGLPGSQYRFTITDQSTQRTYPESYPSRFGAPTGYRFAPETSLFLWFSPIFGIVGQAGRYSVQLQVTGANKAQQLSSNTFVVTVLPKGPLARFSDPDAPSGHSPAGAQKDGLALSLTSPGSPLFDDPIYVDLELRNVSHDDRGAALGLGPLLFDFSIVNQETGETLPRITAGEPDLRAVRGMLGSRGLFPGRSAYARVQLDALYKFTKPGTYSVQVTRAPMHAGGPGNPWDDVTLQSNTLTLHILPVGSSSTARPNTSALREGPPAEAPAGPASHGFALSLATNIISTRIGAPLEVTVELRNVSGEPQYASFGSRQSDYRFTIVARTTSVTIGNRAKSPQRVPSSDMWSTTPLYPGSSFYRAFRLDSLYRFTSPGTYAVKVEGRPIINGTRLTLQSNTIVIMLR
jgi:hypothetical protein